MDWDSLSDQSLSSGRLIQSTNFEVIEREVELRNGFYYLYEDQSMSLQLEDSNLFVRSIYPESDIVYDINEDRTVELNGSVLRGDNKGRLSIGVYSTALDYPLRVIEFQLSAPFHIRGRVSVSEDGVSLKRLDISNMPETASSSYPYTFQYNLSNSLSEDDWEDFPDSSIEDSIEGYDSYDIYEFSQDGGTKIWYKHNNRGSPVRIRLRSAVGKLYYFEALRGPELIRFSYNDPILELKEWIGLPKTLPIIHHKYRFNEDEMKEEWVEYPELLLSSAKDWLDFEPLVFELKSSSATMLDSGSHILLKMSIDLSQSSEIIELIDRFIETISIEINDSIHQITNVEKIDINNDSFEVTLSVIVPVPKSDIKFKTKKTGLISYHLPPEMVNERRIIFVENPFQRKKWKHKIKLLFPTKPNQNPTKLELCNWTDSFIISDAGILLSRIHPEIMTLRKCIFEKIRLTANLFCPECGELMPGLRTCPSYKCGWSSDEENLIDFEKISEHWFTYSSDSSLGNHIFSIDESKLSKGEYVISWNGLSYEFEVE